jgi:hypothetical protein
MKKKNILECSLVYGDCHAIPIDFVRTKKNLDITYLYDCTDIMKPKEGSLKEEEKENDQFKVPFETIKFNYIPREERFLNYSIKKICYELKTGKKEKKEGETEVKGIQNLQLIYINIDGEEEVLLDTTKDKKKLANTIEFQDGEVIEYVIIYCQDEKLCGLDIATNKNQSHKIGKTDVDDPFLVRNDKKIIVGLGCYASEKLGITGIYFYQIDKKLYSICETVGIRQLRAKIKKNKKFIDEIKESKKDLTDKQKLVLNVCNSNDPIYFEILNYMTTY